MYSDDECSVNDSMENSSEEDANADTYEENEDEVEEEDGNQKAISLRDELADIPLGELKELKNRIGLKRYNEAVFGIAKKQVSGDYEDHGDNGFDGDNSRNVQNQRNQGLDTFQEPPIKLKKPNKREGHEKPVKTKSEPMEYSSKRRFPKGKPRVVVKSNKPSTRDPRFSDLSGKYNEELFEKSYSFMQEIKDKEYESVKKRLRKTKDSDKKEELQRLKQKLDSDRKREIEKQAQKVKARERRQEEIGKVKQGKKAFFLKKSDKKKIELADKYRELKATGKFESYMKNKRKRKATKEKRKLPESKLV